MKLTNLTYAMNWIRNNALSILVILVLFAIECDSLFSLACWIWVNPIAQHVSGNIWISLAIVAVLSYLYYETFFQRKSKLMLTAFLTVIIILAKTWSYWDFKGAYYWTMPLFLLIIYVISEFTMKKKAEKSNKPQSDLLKREGFAMSILEDIKSKKDIEHSYNYGLVGEWGSGKSFLMEKMFEKVQKDNSFVSFYFKPWEAPNEKEFATQILNGIISKSDNQELKNKIGRFLTKIETDSSDLLTKTFTTLFSWLISDDSSIDDVKSDLSTYLKKNDKRLVVFLDDLDRLDQAEIKELLRLMRNTFDMPYLFFIVGFDRKYLAKTLSFSEGEFDNYISKFFQVKCNVPLLNRSDLFDKYYKERIWTILSLDPTDDNEKQATKSFISDEVLNLISTPREFENILDSFELSYKNLKNNCDWFTLFQLEILKITNYEFYKFIRENGSSVIEHIDIIIDNKKIDERIKPILKAIDRISDLKGVYRIWDMKYFSKYFSLVNASYEIDMDEFEKAVIGPINLLEMKIMYWINSDKYEDLNRKFSNYIYSNNNLTAALLLAVDRRMSIGPYNRRYVYKPIYFYLYKQLKYNKDRSILNLIKEEFDTNQIYRTIGYYFISDNADTVVSDIKEQFDLLINTKNLKDNEIFWFITHVYSWIANSYYPDANSIDVSIIEGKRTELNLFFQEKMSEFARKDILSFLLNFICPLTQLNHDISSQSQISYTFYNRYVPEIINESEIINLLKKLDQTEAVAELIIFIKHDKDRFGYCTFDFKHNRVIKD